VKKTDKIYVFYITYIWTHEGWLYLAVVIDLFLRQVVGWSQNNRITTKLIMDALQMAIGRRPPTLALEFHSDRVS
jgi:transposase InsO family protein